MTLEELLLALPYNYDYFVRLAEFYVNNSNPVTVSFTGTPTTGISPYEVTFTSSVTGDIARYFWDFGDGYSSTEANPVHEYANEGTYSVICVIQDSVGVQAVQARENYITVNPAP